jgi:hypothetical protein
MVWVEDLLHDTRKINFGWFKNGILYFVSSFNTYPSQAWLEIAESVK